MSRRARPSAQQLRQAAALRLVRGWQDPLLRNSAFLMATSFGVAVLGFAFWLVNARLYRPADIGIATTLLTAVSLLSYLSLFGMNNVIIRCAHERSRDLLGTAVIVVGLVAGTLGLVYATLAPLFVDRLAIVLQGPWKILLFMLLVTASSINVLTDSAFISRRAAHYNLLVNAFLQGIAKLGLAFVLTGLGVFGLVSASGIAVALSAVVSLALLKYRLGFGVSWRPKMDVLRGELRFSFGTYLSSVLNLLPVLAVSNIVLQEFSGELAAYYNIAFQVATFLYALFYAVGESLFAEGAYDSNFRELQNHSAKIMLVVAAGGILGLLVFGSTILGFFGGDYRQFGSPPLVVLAYSGFAVAVNVWSSFLLKIQGRVFWLVVSNLVFVGVSLGLTGWWVNRGLSWVAGAWGLANAASAAVAIFPQFPDRRRDSSSTCRKEELQHV